MPRPLVRAGQRPSLVAGADVEDEVRFERGAIAFEAGTIARLQVRCKLAIYNELGIKLNCKGVSVLRNLDATRLRKANIAAQEMTREARIAKKERN
ncbi:hypothetical protein J6590_081859 [Homalodisca vitripennis]|nr:hypothetical protein J6590_081859 [Homalodisca vitripennis]